MNTLKKIENLLQTSQKLVDSVEKHKENLKDLDCDKHGMGFNLNDKFSAVKFNLSIDSWEGYKNQKGCYTVMNIKDQKLFTDQLVKVLNDNFETLILETAHRLKQNALSLKKDAEKELLETLDYVKNLE